MNRDRHPEAENRTSAAIDAALRSVGTASPAPDLQGRILTRLAAQRINREAALAHSLFPSRLSRVIRASAPFAYGLCACLFCAVIVVGSVSHSRHLHHRAVAPPILTLPGQGIGAASAVHPAAPASTPAPPGQAGRAHRRGRARIAPHAHKAPGVAVPAPPSSDSQN
jgi:hypothetical protein